MTSEHIEAASLAGADTVAELNLWYAGFLAGQLDAITKVTNDMETMAEPDYSELAEEYRQESKEEKEHYADYSDQEKL